MTILQIKWPAFLVLITDIDYIQKKVPKKVPICTCSLRLGQIYGRFFPGDLVTSHFINLAVPNNGISVPGKGMESTLQTLVVATLDKPGTSFQVSGTTFVKMVCIKLVNPSGILIRTKNRAKKKFCVRKLNYMYIT